MEEEGEDGPGYFGVLGAEEGEGGEGDVGGQGDGESALGGRLREVEGLQDGV